MGAPTRYRIHPAIGIARIGNAPPSDFFLGPEVPNQNARREPDVGTAVPPFKSDSLVKRQAARFRVWEYTESGGMWQASREVSLHSDDVAGLTWTVHLANRKASFFRFNGPAGSTSSALPNLERRNAARNTTEDERRLLEIDPLARSIGGQSAVAVGLDKGTSATPLQERWPDGDPTITSLGQLRTDDAGRLIVIPGEGIASRASEAGVGDYANNDDWFDDVGDGPVTATLSLRGADGSIAAHDVEGAWLLVGPPDFAPPLPQLVSLYDVLFDLAVRKLPIPRDESLFVDGELARLSGLAAFFGDGAASSYRINFDTDVAPILRAAFAVTAVFAPAHDSFRLMGGTGIDAKLWAQLSDPGKPEAFRRSIFNRLRKPAGFGAVATTFLSEDPAMPKLLGDDPYSEQPTEMRALSVTPTQHKILEKWFRGDFIGSTRAPSSLLDPPPAGEITPHGLDRAAIESASGGAFFPGIEVGWLIREPSLFAAPFRIKDGAASPYLGDVDESRTRVGAGFFSRQMAVPWLADFLQCKGEFHPEGSDADSSDATDDSTHRWGWWPSQRPDLVVGPGGQRVPWHRASGPDGTPTDWPDSGGPEKLPKRDNHTPSYREMIDNWWKFGFVEAVGTTDPITSWSQYAEAERADNVP